MTSFSERQGHTQARTVAQIQSMDLPLRSGLWNCIHGTFRSLETPTVHGFYGTHLYLLGQQMWHEFYKLPRDEMPVGHSGAFFADLKKRFMGAVWFRVYDLLEFIAEKLPGPPDNFIAECNKVMRREVAGYLFIGKIIAPITTAAEVSEIETAIATQPKPIADHLTASLAFLSDRNDPNYRKSVDEAILSVEAAARKLSGEPKATLGQALKAIKIDLHPALRGAFEKLYGYTSDESGIRHALTDDGRDIDQADARYMLIACSAFVNYLSVKGDKTLK